MGGSLLKAVICQLRSCRGIDFNVVIRLCTTCTVRLVFPMFRVQSSHSHIAPIIGHEPPVRAENVRVIFENATLLVVCKPASVPVHPCGNYRFNTLYYMCLKGQKWVSCDHQYHHQEQQAQQRLYICHRLDKLTSGLVLLAKTGAKAKQIQQQIERRQVCKMYVARVKGHFRFGICGGSFAGSDSLCATQYEPNPISKWVRIERSTRKLPGGHNKELSLRCGCSHFCSNL